MTIPNVGISAVIPAQPNNGLGDVARFVMQLNQLRVEQAQQRATEQYQQQVIAQKQAEMAAEAAAKKAQADAAEAQRREFLQLLSSTGLDPQTSAMILAAGPDKGGEALRDIAKQPGVEHDPTKAFLNARTGASIVGAQAEQPKPLEPLRMTGDQAGVAQSVGLDPNNEKNWTAEDRSKFRRALLERPPSTSMSFNMGNTIAGAMAPKMAEIVAGKADKAASAAADLGTISELNKLMTDGIKTGFGANQLLAIGNALVKAGWADDPSVANTQAYQALVGQRVGEIIKAFGSGTGLSDADREYAEKIAGGKISVDEKAIRKILIIAERRAKALISEGNRAAQSVPEEMRAPFLTDDPSGQIKTNSDGSVPYKGKLYKQRYDPVQGWGFDGPDGKFIKTGG